MGKGEKRTGFERRGKKALLIGASVMAAMLMLIAMPAPVAAKGPPLRIEGLPVLIDPAFNGCTGNPTVITGTLDLVIHEFAGHSNVQSNIETTDGEGFSARAVGREIVNGAGDHLVVTEIFNLNAGNPDTHQRIIFRIHFHVTIVDGEVVSLVFQLVADKCVGKPP